MFMISDFKTFSIMLLRQLIFWYIVLLTATNTFIKKCLLRVSIIFLVLCFTVLPIFSGVRILHNKAFSLDNKNYFEP